MKVNGNTGRALTTIFVDYDNIYLSLKRKSEDAAKLFAKNAQVWLKEIESGRLITTTNGTSLELPRRVVMSRCYGNPVPRRNPSDNSTDMNSFPFVRHNFLRAGFEVIDCPPLTAQLKNSSDIRMVMDVRDLLNHDTYFDEFIILSGDADFTPVLQRLRAHARRTVIFANDYTATPYTAISDGEIRESDLIALLVEGRLPGEEPVAIEAPSTTPALPSANELEAMRKDILAEVVTAVASTSHHVPLEALADRAIRVLGHERTVGSAWGGIGSFRELLQRTLPEQLKLSEQPPYFVYNAARRTARDTDLRPTANEQTEAPRADTTARPQPLRSEPVEPRSDREQRFERPSSERVAAERIASDRPAPLALEQLAPMQPAHGPQPLAATHPVPTSPAPNYREMRQPMAGAMVTAGAIPTTAQAKSPAPSAPSAQPPMSSQPQQAAGMAQSAPAPRMSPRNPLAERLAAEPAAAMPQPPAQATPSAPSAATLQPAPPIPRAPVSQSAQPRSTDGASAIQQSVARIHEACQAPPLSPPEYRVLFDVMAQEITGNGLTGSQTLTNIMQRAHEFGVEVRRDDVRFVLDVVSEQDPWFEQGATANLFANRFRNFVVARCRGQGLALSSDELDLIDAWFAVANAAAQRQVAHQQRAAQPTAQPAAPAQTQPAAAAQSERYWNLDESRQAIGETRYTGTDGGDDYPRILRTRRG